MHRACLLDAVGPGPAGRGRLLGSLLPWPGLTHVRPAWSLPVCIPGATQGLGEEAGKQPVESPPGDITVLQFPPSVYKHTCHVFGNLHKRAGITAELV